MRTNRKMFFRFNPSSVAVLADGHCSELIVLKTIDVFLERQSKPVFDKIDFGQTNEQQRNFNE